MEASGETANLAVLDGDEAVYIDQVPSPRLVRMFEGVRCIAAPVRDHTGCVVAALSISGPTTRMTKERIPEMSRLVISISAELSAAMGHKPAGE